MSKMNERMRRNMTRTMALEMLQNLTSDDSDAGEQSEVESDSDVSWVQSWPINNIVFFPSNQVYMHSLLPYIILYSFKQQTYLFV